MKAGFLCGVLCGIALVYFAVAGYGRLTRCDHTLQGTVSQVEVTPAKPITLRAGEAYTFRGTACDTTPHPCIVNAKRVKP